MASDTKVGEAHVDIVANLSGLKEDLAKVKGQMGGVGSAAGALSMQLTALFTGIGAAFAVFSMVAKVLGGIMSLLKGIVDFVINVLERAFNILKDVIVGVFDAIIAGAKAAFSAMQRFGGFVYKSIRISADFRHEMTEVGAVLSATKAELKLLSDTALELGKKTEFMASEAAMAMKVMARAGLDVNTIIKETAVVIDFATANNIGLAQSAEALLGITRGMGIELKFLGGVADVIAKTAKSSSQDITMMQEAMKNVAAVAGAVGLDIRKVGTALGILANNATQGSLAGSRLRQMLIRLMLPETTAAFEKMGIKLRDSFNRMRPITEIVKEFNAVVPAAQRADKAVEIFGGRSSLAFITMSLAGGKALDAMLAKISKSQGTVGLMAARMRADVEASFSILGSSWEAFQIAVGDIFGPATLKLNIFLADVINVITEIVRKWTPWLQANIKTVMDWVTDNVPKALNALLGTIHFFWEDIANGFTKLLNFFGGHGGFFKKILGLDEIAAGTGPMQALFTIMLNLFDHISLAFGDMTRDMEQFLERFIQNSTHLIKKTAIEASGVHLKGGVLDLRPLEEFQKKRQALVDAWMKEGTYRGDPISGMHPGGPRYKMAKKQAMDIAFNIDASDAQVLRGLGVEPFFLTGPQAGQSRMKEEFSLSTATLNEVRAIMEARGVETLPGGGGKVFGIDMPFGSSIPFFHELFSEAVKQLTGIDESYTDFLRQHENDVKALATLQESKLQTPEEREALLKQLKEDRKKVLDEVFAAGGEGTKSQKWADVVMDMVMGFFKKPPTVLPMPTPPPPPGTPKFTPRPGTPASATAGTIQTAFGAMKVAVGEEVLLLRQVVRWNKMIAENTRTVTLLPLN